ncbi:hypothetical protein [Corynebacterium nuruki]|uniref:hypothetical protein n=1 Tax=Corynebacterium nuruki TaxID=1032851 RepID=UPI0002485A7F|nr:hypothetical protein [Corynebacterium nuruki]
MFRFRRSGTTSQDGSPFSRTRATTPASSTASARLRELGDRAGALLVIDDAYGIGTVGADGRGCATVPRGAAILRVTVMAGHTSAQIAALVRALERHVKDLVPGGVSGSVR